jgi:hypothetical protein
LRKILIISPHYPPSNLTSVHRSRIFAQHLPSYGWDPIILTVHENYYEESLDWDLHKLLPTNQKIEKVKAFKIIKPRLIGDIGLRAYFQLRKRALELIGAENIDFVYIPIPSFYTALIGSYLHKKTGVKYGIDYIDPWVHKFPGSEKVFSRHWFSSMLARILEPIAVKHASLITGVSEAYYSPVFERNAHLKTKALRIAMPYGGEEGDHQFARQIVATSHREIGLIPPKSNNKIFRFVYAGAILPKAHELLEEIFKALQQLNSNNIDLTFRQPEFYFIGTGGIIKALAKKYDLYELTVFEYQDRMPYLDVLLELEKADGIFILGSTEPHYTPSKVFQAVLSNTPILAVLHQDSTAVNVLKESRAGVVILIKDVNGLASDFLEGLREFDNFQKSFSPMYINKEAFTEYSANAVTKLLADKLNVIYSSGH